MRNMEDIVELKGTNSFIEDFIIVYYCQRVTVDYSDKPRKVREFIGPPSIFKIGSHGCNNEYNFTSQPTFQSSSHVQVTVNLDQAVSFSDGIKNIQLPNHQSLDLHLKSNQSDKELEPNPALTLLDSLTKSVGMRSENLSEESCMVSNLDEISGNVDHDKNKSSNIEKDVVKNRRKPKAKSESKTLRKVCPRFSFPKSPSKNIACEECSKEFKMQVSYLLHKAIHSFQIDCGKYICSACNKTFLSAIRLIQHKRTMCLYPEYVCKFCGKRHVSKELLTHHTNYSCTAFQAIAHTCPKCLKKFFTRNGFLKHQRKKACRRNSLTSESERAVKYQCELCGKVYATKSSLSKHIRCHKGIKNYECDKCRKCFADNHQLSVHQRMHSGEKPYLCNQCGKSFGQAGHLNRHLKKHSQSLTSSSGFSNQGGTQTLGVQRSIPGDVG